MKRFIPPLLLLLCLGQGCPFADADGDGVPDTSDNCVNVVNANQADRDGDGVGDACDNCPNIANPDQANLDNDGAGNACDLCRNDPAKTAPGQCGCGKPDTDTDGDGVADCKDNCPTVANADQADADGNGVGIACEPSLLPPTTFQVTVVALGGGKIHVLQSLPSVVVDFEDISPTSKDGIAEIYTMTDGRTGQFLALPDAEWQLAYWGFDAFGGETVDLRLTIDGPKAIVAVFLPATVAPVRPSRNLPAGMVEVIVINNTPYELIAPLTIGSAYNRRSIRLVPGANYTAIDDCSDRIQLGVPGGIAFSSGWSFPNGVDLVSGVDYRCGSTVAILFTVEVGSDQPNGYRYVIDRPTP